VFDKRRWPAQSTAGWDWKELTHLLISHGRGTCTARNPDCGDCRLEDVCPSSKLDDDVDLADGSEW